MTKQKSDLSRAFSEDGAHKDPRGRPGPHRGRHDAWQVQLGRGRARAGRRHLRGGARPHERQGQERLDVLAARARLPGARGVAHAGVQGPGDRRLARLRRRGGRAEGRRRGDLRGAGPSWDADLRPDPNARPATPVERDGVPEGDGRPTHGGASEADAPVRRQAAAPRRSGPERWSPWWWASCWAWCCSSWRRRPSRTSSWGSTTTTRWPGTSWTAFCAWPCSSSTSGSSAAWRTSSACSCYHGAEHKAIHCFEHGLPMTPENARAVPAPARALRHRLPHHGHGHRHPRVHRLRLSTRIISGFGRARRRCRSSRWSSWRASCSCPLSPASPTRSP